MQYVELHCKSNFSFLEGASNPDELVLRAAELGYAGIALTDRESVAGVVRGYTPAKELGLKYLVGTEVHPTDAPPMLLVADRPRGLRWDVSFAFSWADACRQGQLRTLLVGHRRAE